MRRTPLVSDASREAGVFGATRVARGLATAWLHPRYRFQRGQLRHTAETPCSGLVGSAVRLWSGLERLPAMRTRQSAGCLAQSRYVVRPPVIAALRSLGQEAVRHLGNDQGNTRSIHALTSRNRKI